MDGYGDWIQLVAEFTLKSLQSWQVNFRKFMLANALANLL